MKYSMKMIKFNKKLRENYLEQQTFPSPLIREMKIESKL